MTYLNREIRDRYMVTTDSLTGTDLARSPTDLGLIDEYRLYFRPVVLGRSKPFFAGPRPPLHDLSTISTRC